MSKKASIELTAREIMILLLVIIILAVVIFIGVSKLGLIQKAIEILSGQGSVIGPAT